MKLESTITEKAGFLYTAPLLDGVLLLLVFFVVGSSSVSKSGVQVNLPSSISALPESSSSHLVTVVDGAPPKIYFNETRIDMSQLTQQLQVGKQTSNKLTILADENCSYGSVMKVAITALNMEYDVSFGTQPGIE